MTRHSVLIVDDHDIVRVALESLMLSSPELTLAGSGSFGPAPEYQAANSDSNTGLRVTNLPPAVGTTLGGMVYVTEIYSPHQMLTPFNRFGFTLPTSLYSIAYF